MMKSKLLIEAFCQSCASALRRTEDLGTNERGHRVHNYCRHCYRDGRFVEPNLTTEDMILRVTTELSLAGMIEMVVVNEVTALISNLDRWRSNRSEKGPQYVDTRAEVCNRR
jgi:hypothetical protein